MNLQIAKVGLQAPNSCCSIRKQLPPLRATATPEAQPAKPEQGKPFINEIPNNGQWPNGIPPVMGGHLMASGVVSPISTSKGAGLDVEPHQFQYPSTEGDAQIVLHTSAQAASNWLGKAVIEASEAAIKAKGSFTLVLSGGSLINQLSSIASLKGVKWEKFHVFFVDERNVLHTSDDSNYKAAKEALLSKVPIPDNQIYKILENVTAKQAATQYEGQLLSLPTSVLPRNEAGWPIFDLILLGVGPDGHIASLFPNRPETAATEGWVIGVTNSPKPPPERISFTLPVINAAKDILIVAIGESKAEIVQRVLEVQSLPGALPAQLVRPTNGRLRWSVDILAAQQLDIASWGDSKAFPRSQ